MTKTDNETKAIEGQKTIGEQHQEQRKQALECPACGFKIRTPEDHEPGCDNSDWSRQDVIDHIMKQSAKAGAKAKEPRESE